MKTLSKKKDLEGQIKLAEFPTFTVINSEKAIPKKVTLIFDGADSSYVESFIDKYDEKKVVFSKYINWNKALNENILEKFDYILFFVSERSMKNNGIIRLLLKNYKNNNFITIISDPIFLELKGRVIIYKYWEEQLSYAKGIIQSNIINKDVCNQYILYENIMQMLGDFFDKAYEDNLLRENIEDVFESRLSQDGIHDLRKKYSESNQDVPKQQKEKQNTESREVLDYMNQNNYYAENITINNGRDKSRFKTTINNSEQTEEINRIMEQIKNDLTNLQTTDADKISNAIDDLKEEMKKGKLEKGKINTVLEVLASMIAVATGIPNLAENLSQLINHIKLLPMH